ncbi:alkaline phosphatase family protein [Verrucomicrobiaceae bacterium R5-34]|nr:alkaline phosphatase family protein [Verrucomicrobiaceae bacterium R5-34]
MMIRIFLSLLFCCTPLLAEELHHQTFPNDNPGITLSHFAFGSCWKSSHSQKHWQPIVSNKPQLWLWLGDNIYADTHDMGVMKKKYAELGATTGYRQLAASCPVLATWDDHDYGWNDAGSEYPERKESEQLFLEFFDERPDSPRRKREGVYTSYYFGEGDKRVQLILLDTRYFRSELKRIDGKPPYRPMGRWTPDESPEKTMLGDAQWKWLEGELQKPARIRLIGTSIQFAAHHTGYEAWNNLPREQQRLVDLIVKHRAEGVVFLSGDIHSAELNVMDPENCYSLVDFTSSSLNVPLGAARTRRRVGPGYGGANFAMVDIDWEAKDPTITLAIKDTNNETRLQHRVQLSELTFDKTNLIAHATYENLAGKWETFYGPLTLTKKSDGKWSGHCADRKLSLKESSYGLEGSWQGEKRSGKVRFELTRDGQFLRGSYSYEELPLQLEWSGWKMDWEKYFTRDDYHLRSKN